jgi:general secretion pathway protein F
MLLKWGTFAAANRYVLVFTIIGLIVTSTFSLAHAHKSGRLERLISIFPGIRDRIQLFRLSRLYLTVGTLLNGGMPLVQALQLSQDLTRGAQLEGLKASIEALRRGQPISSALSEHGLTTPISLRLLRASDGTGQMGEMFLRAGRYHDNELGRWIERFSKIFEPVLMAIIGIVVGGIVILLYLPIFDLAENLR